MARFESLNFLTHPIFLYLPIQSRVPKLLLADKVAQKEALYLAMHLQVWSSYHFFPTH